jgi:hypothetical protein
MPTMGKLRDREIFPRGCSGFATTGACKLQLFRRVLAEIGEKNNLKVADEEISLAKVIDKTVTREDLCKEDDDTKGTA